VKLSDKYTRSSGSVYLTGIQALVRLPMDQMRRDRLAGLRTGAFVSGYEGSPLAGFDLAIARERVLLDEHNIHFWPAVNEDLAATAIMGAMIAGCMGPLKVDGVVGLWYGKGPGVDRSGDIFRHANLAGCSGANAALVLAGDDHPSKSSTIPHQSDFSLMNAGMPVLVPGNTQEILDYGLLGIALSRHTGSWTGLKLVTNVCDGGGSVNVDPARLSITTPVGYTKKTDHRLIIPYSLESEYQMSGPRLEAAREFAWQNKLNHSYGATQARIGIAAVGKAYYDLMQALTDLGIDQELEKHGIRIAKFGMTFPLEHRFAREFAQGLETLLVVEEKRSFLEMQLRDSLYGLTERPVIIGKQDRDGRPLLPASGELDPDILAVIVSRVLGLKHVRAERLERQIAAFQPVAPARVPAYCSGCPHNRSTMLLEGQVAGGGTGCHGMGILMTEAQRGYEYCTHMGGEGAPWIGMAPFSERTHILHNLGDGTYFHSGSLAVQACVAAGVNITFRLLYNGHVAMTGGQMASNALPVPELTRKLEADGVKRIVVLVEDVEKYASDRPRFAANAEIRDRFELESTMRELEKVPGVTVMLYDQECAAEKRRARSRGKQVEPTERLYIHPDVCEGCGDCVKQSNCMSLHPVATEKGDKIQIHQSSCNKDYTCALGDCPSFVTVKIKPGTALRQRKLPVLPETDVAEPAAMATIPPAGYRIVMPGIGGTGVLTINALLATAATIEGLEVISLDQTGLAQKGGSVVSHLCLGQRNTSARTNAGNADLMLAFDRLGVTSTDNFKTMDAGRTAAVINSDLVPTAESIRKRLVLVGREDQVQAIVQASRRAHFVDASRLAEMLFGSHLAVNVFLLGVAWQYGLLPLRRASLEEAIRLNGVEVQRNLQAFLWGRKYVEDPDAVERQLAPPASDVPRPLDRYAELTAYQNAAYAQTWRSFVEAQPAALRETVGRYLYKLMAYKDEYEVARLLTNQALTAQLSQTFEQVEWHGFQLHPPLLRALGWKRKLKFGAWFATPLALMAKGKFLRGTALDPFGWMRHRREERELVDWYRALVAECVREWTPERNAEIQAILSMPDQIRGYDEIKSRSIQQVKAEVARRMSALRTSEKTEGAHTIA
jgi:indolepyruvate ferredoxin oxidoreductase